MEEYFLEWIPENRLAIALISILLNIFIAISGVLPSTFLTAANIAIFDLKIGLIISIIGESLGAIISFSLYRQGIAHITKQVNVKNNLLKKLQHTKGLHAFLLVFVLRILPFVPSGLVTLTAAYSEMGLYTFIISSTMGKLPSLLIEAYSIEQFFTFSIQWQLIILITLLLFITCYYILKRKNSRRF